MLKLNNSYVSGDSRDLRNFFMDLCDSIEKQERMWEQVEEMENKLDEAIGVETDRNELRELVLSLQERLVEKANRVKELETQVKYLKKVNKELTQTGTDVAEASESIPKLKVKKKIIKKIK